MNFNDLKIAKLKSIITDVPQNTIVLFGDSITANNESLATNPMRYSATGYFTWANVLLNHRFKLLKNSGISGNTTTQMLARIQTDVLAYKPRWCVVFGGVNDCIQGFNSTTTINNLTQIYNTLISSGINVIACTITPSTSMDTTAKKNTMHIVNRWIKDYSQTHKGIVVCDWHGRVVDASTGNAITNYTTDGTHPTTYGAAILGDALYNTLSSVIPNIDLLPNDNFDPTNFFTNGLCIGNNAGVATGYTVSTSGSPTYTASKVTRTDGIAGEWQQIQITGVGTVKTSCANTAVGTTWNVGDTVYAQCEFQTDNDWSNVTDFEISLVCYTSGYGSTLLTSSDLARYAGDGTIPSYRPAKGTLKTPLTIIPSTTAILAVVVCFTGVGTVRFSRVELRKA